MTDFVWWHKGTLNVTTNHFVTTMNLLLGNEVGTNGKNGCAKLGCCGLYDLIPHHLSGSLCGATKGIELC